MIDIAKFVYYCCFHSSYLAPNDAVVLGPDRDLLAEKVTPGRLAVEQQRIRAGAFVDMVHASGDGGDRWDHGIVSYTYSLSSSERRRHDSCSSCQAPTSRVIVVALRPGAWRPNNALVLLSSRCADVRRTNCYGVVSLDPPADPAGRGWGGHAASRRDSSHRWPFSIDAFGESILRLNGAIFEPRSMRFGQSGFANAARPMAIRSACPPRITSSARSGSSRPPLAITGSPVNRRACVVNGSVELSIASRKPRPSPAMWI